MADFLKAHSYFIALNNGFEHLSGADFSKAQEMVKKSEGGYSTAIWDRGNYICDAYGKGAWAKGTSQKGKTEKDFTCNAGSLKFVGTNWGIAAPVLAEYLGRTPTAAEMKALPYDTAKAIFKRNYWDKINGDAIKDQNVANMLYDSTVQSEGMTKTILNNTFADLNIPKVSSLGASDTTSQINKANQKKLFETFKKYRVSAYEKAGQDWGIDRTLKIVYEYTKRNWIPLTVSFIAIAGLTYTAFRYRTQITKAIFN